MNELSKIKVTERAELAESKLNRISDGSGCFSMNQTAKALKLPYGNKIVTLVTGKGLVYLAGLFNTEIDESVKADFSKSEIISDF